jgi:hypothetical protein
MLERAERASHIDPPASSHAIMQRAGPTAERTLDPARMFAESLTPRPELENSQGQTLPSRDFCGTAALPLKPDIARRGWHGRKVPGADIGSPIRSPRRRAAGSIQQTTPPASYLHRPSAMGRAAWLPRVAALAAPCRRPVRDGNRHSITSVGRTCARREQPRGRRTAESGQQFPPSNGDCHAPLPCEGA